MRSVTFQWPRKFEPFFRPKRYKVAWGGRGGMKSWAIARLLIWMATRKPLLILCTREFQKSITESVHKLLSNQIEAMGYGDFFTIGNNKIVGKNGSQFIFAGLRNNITNIKSMEGVDIVWVEEAEKVSKNSWGVLIPTIRKALSEVWVSFNPDEESDPTYKMFIVNPPPDSVVIEFNWRDNPWLSKELEAEKDYLYKVDPEAAQHIWEGKCNTRSDSQIFAGKYVIEAFEPDPRSWAGPHFGLDFGFSSDPSALVKTWEYAHKLYIEYAVFGHGLKNDELDKLIRTVPGAADQVIRGDCSRPETIAHLSEDFGLHVVPCKKWSGCVEDGIQYLRSFEQIVIHPRNRQMADEARLYRYKVDRVTGDVLPIIVDKHNHGWDGVRYAEEPAIFRLTEEVIVMDGNPEGVSISPELDEAEYGITNW